MSTWGKFGHKPKKGLGQVFLKNENIKKKIAGFVNGSKYKSVLEIGPGLGAITQFIDFDKKEYVAVEIDKSLARCLELEYPRAKIIVKDFLDYEWNEDFDNNNQTLLFGNIPYYASTPIILKFLKSLIFPEFYVMVQKEYFEMLKAEFCTCTYSSFSVLLQTCCEVKKIININRLNFFPKPNVDSVFLSMTKKNTRIFEEFDFFARFLRVCFSMPRKTLNNNLRSVVNDPKIIEKIYIDNDLKTNIRPQEISPELFETIFFKLDVVWKDILGQTSKTTG